MPVINGGDGDGEHPTQSLLDLFTIYSELGRLDDFRIALVGDLRFGRTVHSLVRLLMNFSAVQVCLVSPPALQLPDRLIQEARDAGVTISTTDQLEHGLAGVDVVYTTRLQRERISDSIDAPDEMTGYALNASVVNRFCGERVILMHPLPRDTSGKVCELDVDLNDDPRLAIFRQTDNGIPIRMALFLQVLARREAAGF